MLGLNTKMPHRRKGPLKGQALGRRLGFVLVATSVLAGVSAISTQATASALLRSQAAAEGFAEHSAQGAVAESGCTAFVTAAARARCYAEVQAGARRGQSNVDSATQATTDPFSAKNGSKVGGSTTAEARSMRQGSIQSTCAASAKGLFGGNCRSGGFISFGGDFQDKWVPSGTGSRTSAFTF